MYLKRVEITGFKTFADTTVVEFGPGVTSTIGPNGCGKSNVVDSIRWAMGEQSAKSLRCTDMTDVIFNGNARRRPGPFCNVCVTIDNSDKSLNIDSAEVSIRRKLHRNGDNEYFLNEQPSRLKDLRELLMDTGIGARNNTVIEQEQLNRLIQASSKERKVFIEEAAGISKYRQRRKESSSKLGNVQGNVERLQMIIDEVQKQLKTVRNQANKAMRFEKLQSELRSSKLDIATIDLHIWISARLELEEKRTLLQQGISAFKIREEEAQKEMDLINEKEQSLDIELARLQAEQQSFFQAYTGAESTVKTNKGLLESLNKELGEIEQELCKSQEDLIKSRQDLEQDQSEDGGFGEDLAELEKSLQLLRSDEQELSLCIQKKRSALQHGQNAEMELIRRRSGLQNEIIKTESNIEHLNHRLDDCLKKLHHFEETLKAQGADPELLLKLEQLKEQHEKTLGLKTERDRKTQSARDGLRNLELELRKLASENSGLRSRFHVLREMAERFEGMGKGVQAVLDFYVRESPQEATYPGGIHGLVADQLTVPDDYLEAIEAALGPRMQNIVTSTAQDAKHAIEFLRKKQMGRATFLPLDRVRDRPAMDRRVLSYPGVRGEACALVGFDPIYRHLFSQLLNGVVVVDTMDHALAINKDHRVRIVTLDGDLITPEGAMTGGGKGNEVGLISRKAEIDELERALGEKEVQHEQLERQQEKLMDDEQRLFNESRQIESSLKECEDQLRTLEHQLEMDKKDLVRFEQEKIILQRERDILQADISAASASLETQKISLEELHPENKEEINREELQEEISNLLKDQEVLSFSVRDMELKRVSLTERAQSMQNKKVYLTERISELEERIERRNNLFNAKAKDKDRLEQEYEQASTILNELEKDKEGHQSRFFDLKTEQENSRQRRNELLKEAQQLISDLRKKEQELSGLAVKEEGIRVKQEELFRRIHEEFHLSIEDTYLARRQSLDPLFERAEEFPQLAKEMRERLADIENRLQSLGNVNFEAVEEMKELEGRELGLLEQMSDLKGSLGKLDEYLKDLDKKCSDMLAETFNEIQANFQMMFERLFSGGTGRLYFDEDTDPLEAGVNIAARPPGKSPKSLSQLSGGEKVMTTIAFLFAIFLTKPSPFCILDEIDAPLDENNVDRFMEAIRSFTNSTQFLIVTHNRRTMSLSDLIHGVTMQESGVSTCVSIELQELDKHMADMNIPTH